MFAHLLGIREWEVDGLTVKAFHLYCDWVDEHNKPPKEPRRGR